MRKVLEKCEFDETGLLFQVLERFKNADLHPDTIDNPTMGTIFEELIRKFNETLNENPGEHFTPRNVVYLMADLMLAGDEDRIRRYTLEHDVLEALIALPEQLFCNTRIATYVWVVTNRKAPACRGKIQLVDAISFWVPMRNSLGDKRRKIRLDRAEDFLWVVAEVTGGRPEWQKTSAHRWMCLHSPPLVPRQVPRATRRDLWITPDVLYHAAHHGCPPRESGPPSRPAAGNRARRRAGDARNPPGPALPSRAQGPDRAAGPGDLRRWQVPPHRRTDARPGCQAGPGRRLLPADGAALALPRADHPGAGRGVDRAAREGAQAQT
jgi:hypothetical protein